MLTAVTGINWGDEGKGRVIDLLAEHADIVVRYQGGNNAGHTVVNKQGKFVLNLLPSGILHPDVVCVLGDGMVIDLNHLSNEIAQIRTQDISVSPKNLKFQQKPQFQCRGIKYRMSLRKSAFQSPEQPSALPNAVLPMHTAINTVKKQSVSVIYST